MHLSASAGGSPLGAPEPTSFVGPGSAGRVSSGEGASGGCGDAVGVGEAGGEVEGELRQASAVRRQERASDVTRIGGSLATPGPSRRSDLVAVQGDMCARRGAASRPPLPTVVRPASSVPRPCRDLAATLPRAGDRALVPDGGGTPGRHRPVSPPARSPSEDAALTVTPRLFTKFSMTEDPCQAAKSVEEPSPFACKEAL